MSNNPQHQLTGSEELLKEIADLLRHNTEAGKREAVLEWHTKHLAKARLQAQIDSYREMITLIPGARTKDNLHIVFGRYITALEAQLASMEKTDDK